MSFFYTLKVELIHRRRFAIPKQAPRELFTCIEGYDIRHRLENLRKPVVAVISAKALSIKRL